MALKVLCSSFFGRPLPLMWHWTHNTIWHKSIKYILFKMISIILLQDSEISWKNSVLDRIWSQSWRTSRSFGGRKIGWRLEYEETNSHERSTWRLRTPTICRRSVPALCNAGLPKKKTLQQGKINRKTNELVLVSTTPSQSILSCYLLIGNDYL